MEVGRAKPRLMDQMRNTMRMKHYSRRTEKAYRYWIRYFIKYHGTRHPASMGAAEVRAFLEHLAVERNVAAATQNQALNAVVFLYRRVLETELGDIGEVTRAKTSRHLPVVFSHEQAMAVIDRLEPPVRLIAGLMYGSGLRVVEACRLRVRDVELDRRVITVRGGKGDKDRTTLLPEKLVPALGRQIRAVEDYLAARPAEHRIPVTLPHALERKYPNAGISLGWQWLFPSTKICANDDGEARWHHLHTSAVQKQVRAAIRECDTVHRGSCHTFRHSFATQLLQHGTDIRTVQELMGHKSVETTQIYTHVLGTGFAGVRSPLG